MEKYWIVESTFSKNKPFYFRLIKFLFFLLDKESIQEEVYKLFALIIDKSCKSLKTGADEYALRENMSKTLDDCLGILRNSSFKDN